jgi:hypothetical protein
MHARASVLVGQAGPRAGYVSAVDAYDNLILLCSRDHKKVDDQVGYYTVERLREMKATHERWVRSLGERLPSSPTSRTEEAAARRARRDADATALRARADEIRQRRDRQFTFSVTNGKAATTNPLAVKGRDSKVLELDLIRGGYRMNWKAEGTGAWAVTHESGRGGRGSLIAHEALLSAKSSAAGEELVRIDESGRHIFSVKAAGLVWELLFSPL